MSSPPLTEITTSETPPASHSFIERIFVCQPLLFANFIYILIRSPAKIFASSPPAEPLISSIISLSSIGSLGSNNTFILSSYSRIFASFDIISLFKNSLIEGSFSPWRSSFASAMASLDSL